MHTYIPNKEVLIRPWNKPWYNSALKKERRELERSHKLAKRLNTPSSWDKFRALRNECHRECKQSENEYPVIKCQKLIDPDVINSRKWWTLLKSFTGKCSNTGIGPIYIDGKIITDDLEKAEAFNTFFAIAIPVLILLPQASLSKT